MFRDLLRFCEVNVDSDERFLAAARTTSHKLAATMLGVLARERELKNEESNELALYRRRFAFYQQLAEDLRLMVPGIQVIKGLNIARYYPSGLVRSSADLDLHCTPDQIWRIGSILSDKGWKLTAFTLFHGVSRVEIVVVYQKPGDTEFEDSYEIEFKTVRFDGDSEPETVGQPTVIDTLVALLVERTEQPFRARDYLDIALLLHQLSPDDIPALRMALNSTERWPEWHEAGTQLARLGWLPPHAATLESAERSSRIRVKRTVMKWLEFIKPSQVGYKFARWTVENYRGEWADKIATRFHELGGSTRAFDKGLPLFGVLLTEEASGEMRLVRRGPHLVANTPIGSFLMVAGVASEDWLTEAQTVEA
jgi:hypothetical protein